MAGNGSIGPKTAKVHDWFEFLEYSIFISLFVPGPKVFATEADYHEFDGYSEEVLALAIVMTAFVALVIGKKKLLSIVEFLPWKIIL